MNSRETEYDKLLADYRELQLRVTRFSAVEQELINTRDKLDAELVLYKRLNNFIKDGLKFNTEKKFLQLVCETIVDIFEVESALVYLKNTDISSESLLVTEGINFYEKEEASFLQAVENLSKNFKNQRASILDNKILEAHSEFSFLSRALYFKYSENSTNYDLYLMGFVSKDLDPIYQPFLPRHEAILSVFGQQVYSLLNNIKNTEKIQTQVKEISKSQAELRKLSQIAIKTKNGVIIADSYGRIEWVNEAFENITGYTLDEVKACKPKDFLQGKETDEKTLLKLKTALKNKEYVEVIVTNYKKNGEKYYNALQINPIFDENGQHQNFIALQRDITEELLAKNELINVNERFELIAEKSHIAIWEVDYLNQKSTWNQELLTQYGIDESDLGSEPLSQLKKYIHPDDRNTILGHINNFINSNDEIIEYEFRIVKGISQEIRILKALIIAERDRENKLTKLLGTNIDITEKKLQEKNLENHLKQQELLAEIALEINNSESLNNRINSVLKKMLIHSHVSRVYIFENIDQGNACKNTYEICGNGIAPFIDDQKYISYIHDIAYIKDTLLQKGNMFADDISIFPEQIRTIFKAQGIKSIILFPLFVKGEFFGFIGLDECVENRIWTKSELELIRAVSGIISTAFERDQSEKNIIASEKKYRNIIDNMNLGLVEVDLENNVKYGNQKFFELSKLLDPALLIFNKRSSSKLVTLRKENKISYLNKLDQKTYEIGLPKNNNESLDLLVSFADTYGQNGKKNGSVSVFLDITSVKLLQKNLESAIKERDNLISKSIGLKNFYENVLNNLPLEVMVLSPDLKVTFSNKQFYDNENNLQNEIGKSVYELKFLKAFSNSKIDLMINKIQESIENEKLVQFEEEIIKSDELDSCFLKNILPVFDDNNNLENIIIIGVDITEIKNIEKNILLKNQELKKINSELDNFVYSVSHDLRSPLLSVKGLLSLIFKTTQIEPKVENYLKMAEKSILRLDETIQEILEYSRNARLGLHYDQVNLSELINNIYEDIKYSNPQKITFTAQIDFDKIIIIDKARLNTVLKNVIGNAFKYLKKSDDSFVKFNAKIEDNCLLIKVSDNGEGISQEHLKRIFDMFYRASNTSAGTGLGLYICKEILNKLNGEIEISSVINEGTTVFIKIPLEDNSIDKI